MNTSLTARFLVTLLAGLFTAYVNAQVSMTIQDQEQSATSGDCPHADSIAGMISNARDLIQQKYSVEAMVCAVNIYYQLARSKQVSTELQVEAMTAMNDVLYFLRIITAQDLMGVNRDNVERIKSIEGKLLKLVQAASGVIEDKPEVMINVALAAKITDGAFNTVLLERAIAEDPGALNGLALIKLGRMLFNLPSILGGNFQQSIVLLEQAVKIDPSNIQALYYLAEAYEQELLEKKATMMMERMLDHEPDFAGQQMAADMLRLAIGLSKRMGKVALSKELQEKRISLLKQNPKLLTRVSIAVGGHGGEHPLELNE